MTAAMTTLKIVGDRGYPELPHSGSGRREHNGPPPSPPSEALPSMSALCGSSWAPLHTLPGYPYRGHCPGRRRPCAGWGKWNGRLSPLCRWASLILYSFFCASLLIIGLLIGGTFDLCLSIKHLPPILLTIFFFYWCNQQFLGGQQVFSETDQSFLHNSLMFDFCQ